MGNIDTETKKYVQRPEVFADLFNYLIYGGQSIIEPGGLTAMDSTEIYIPYDNTGKAYPAQKFRDALKSAVIMQDQDAAYTLILGVENQTDIHYAMPVKNMAYDAYNFASQVTATARKHKADKDHAGKAEFLSGMHKDDRLIPVITLVVYFGQKPWDGPMSIHDMLTVPKPDLLRFVPDYRINLISPVSMDMSEIRKFSSDFKELASFIRCGKDHKLMQELMETDDRFKHMDPLTANIANDVTGAGLNLSVNKEGEVDMCVAIAGIKEEGRSEGESIILNLIQKLFAMGRGAEVQRVSEDEAYRNKVMEELGLK